jgi:hypothetical protein
MDNLLDRAAVTIEDALDGLSPVGDKVPPIRYMRRLRRVLAAACSIRPAAGARNDLGSRIRLVQAGKRLRLKVWQKIYEAVILEINERTTVASAFTVRPPRPRRGHGREVALLAASGGSLR